MSNVCFQMPRTKRAKERDNININKIWNETKANKKTTTTLKSN